MVCRTFLSTLILSAVLVGQEAGSPSGPQIQCPGGPDCELVLCSDYDSVASSQNPHGTASNLEHSMGSHSWGATANDYCDYQEGSYRGNELFNCTVLATTTWSGAATTENGALQNEGFPDGVHYPGHNEIGTAGTRGSTSTSRGAAAFSTAYCSLSEFACTYTGIGFDGNLNPLYTYHLGATGHQVGTNYSLTNEGVTCPFEWEIWISPLVIDLEGGTFDNAFTDKQHGVYWDMKGSGHPIHLAWTNPKRRIGFLVLDRNKDGIINSGKEMFGNLTNQPLSEGEGAAVKSDAAAAEAEGREPTRFDFNGFHALAVFDRKQYGGNGDGRIDRNDAVWPDLRVWVDTCQNADSRCGEMYTLDELGIAAISLKYQAASRVDEYGNQLRYVGTLTMSKPTSHVPLIYDVYFSAQ